MSDLGYFWVDFELFVNLLGFICAINPLHRDRTIKYYTDGSSVYIKKNVENATDGTGDYFSLVELKNHLQDSITYDINCELFVIMVLLYN